MRRKLEILVSRLKLRRCRTVGDLPTVLGRVWIHGDGEVYLGSRVVLDGRIAPIELHAHRGGRIVLHDDVVLEGGTSIEAQESVTIGARSHLGCWCKVLDNHYHPLRGNRHERPASVPLVIEESVTVGHYAILLPGTYLQTGARVMPRTVISRRIPAGATVGKPPTRPLPWELVG